MKIIYIFIYTGLVFLLSPLETLEGATQRHLISSTFYMEKNFIVVL